MSDPSENKIIKVVSFNVKHDLPLVRSHRWQQRREAAAAFIRESGASIIGVQELTPEMRADLEALLGDEFTVMGFGRYYGIKEDQDEHSDIIIRNADAQVHYCKTFWLSKKPEAYGSRAYYSFFPRICTVAEITLNDCGKRVRVFNTHFDHICGMARTLGVRIILDYMEGFNRMDPLPTILMGDLNARYKSRPIRILRENLHEYEHVHLTDIYSKADPSLFTNTFHNFSRSGAKPGRSPIDYIFISDDLEVVEAEVCTGKYCGEYPSDHYPLSATLRVKRWPEPPVPPVPEEKTPETANA